MAISTKTIKKSLRSIGNTKKITKAMEMVSAAKMKKSVNAVLSSRDFAATAWEMVERLVARLEYNHALINPREEVKNVAVILMTSNRGLCGGFNSQIIAQTMNFVSAKQKEKSLNFVWLTLGKKGADFLARNKQQVEAVFDKPDIVNSSAEVMALVKMITNNYMAKKYDEVYLAYTDYYSAMIQKPKIRQLLPLSTKADADLGSINQSKKSDLSEKIDFEYLFEPNIEAVLDKFLPQLILIQVYQALLESNASEHSARMLAMKNASQAASDMISSLTLAFNQARQASITREIAEITGGKAALEQ